MQVVMHRADAGGRGEFALLSNKKAKGSLKKRRSDQPSFLIGFVVAQTDKSG